MWDDTAQTLSGVATRPAGERGNVFVLLPRQWRLVNHQGVNLMKEVRDMTAVARLPVAFETDRAAFELHFEQLDVPNVAWAGWLPYTTVEEWLAYVEQHRAVGDTRVVE